MSRAPVIAATVLAFVVPVMTVVMSARAGATGPVAAAAAAPSPFIDTVAGVYKQPRRLSLVEGGAYDAENVLEIVKVRRDRAYVRTQLYFNNGHQCALNGLASVLGDNLVLKQIDDPSGDVCELMLSVEGGRIVFHDRDNMCMMHNCGMRGSFEGTNFALSSRRAIRYMKRLLASREYRAALRSGTPSGSPPAWRVDPMHVDASLPRYPRLIAFPNARVRQKVNAHLAAAEKQAREDRAGCFGLIRDAGRRPSDANFRMVIDVRYLSSRYLSMEIRRSYDCAGPYPTDNMPEPLTFDLTTGDHMDWFVTFTPGFFPDDGDGAAPVSMFSLYRARYAKEGGRGAPECRRVVAEQLGNLHLRLDARKGLVAQPEFPHALAVCADEIVFTPAEIARHVQDAKFLADLRATIGK
jgi:hypothetical protein